MSNCSWVCLLAPGRSLQSFVFKYLRDTLPFLRNISANRSLMFFIQLHFCQRLTEEVSLKAEKSSAAFIQIRQKFVTPFSSQRIVQLMCLVSGQSADNVSMKFCVIGMAAHKAETEFVGITTFRLFN